MKRSFVASAALLALLTAGAAWARGWTPVVDTYGSSRAQYLGRDLPLAVDGPGRLVKYAPDLTRVFLANGQGVQLPRAGKQHRAAHQQRYRQRSRVSTREQATIRDGDKATG